LAKASHPDLNADDAMAEKRFREISHAYEILSNPGSRAAYDLGLEHKHAKGHRATGRAIGSMAAAFLLTIGCGPYFWHAELTVRQAPTEVSDNHGSHKITSRTARATGPAPGGSRFEDFQ